jgi:translation initiation factor 2B subunit (eIF-2B alpha/beta/delta family)
MNELEAAFRKAARDRRHGAAAIERRLLESIEACRSLDAAVLARGAATLAAGQPTMANLRAVAMRVGASTTTGFAHWAACRLAVLRDLPSRLAAAAWPLLRGVSCVISTSRSSAIAAVLQGAFVRGWVGRVVVLDGGQSRAGRDQAKALAAVGLGVESRPDRDAAAVVSSGAVVLVGADAIGPGAFVNAAGTGELLRVAAGVVDVRAVVADRGKDVDAELFTDLTASLDTDADAGSPVFELVPLGLVDLRVHEDGRDPA